MNDKIPEFCDYSSTNISCRLTDSDDPRDKTKDSQNRIWVFFGRSFVKKSQYLPANFRDACFPFACIENEKVFLRLQSYLRNQETSEVNEAMYVLDCIDTKAQSLLAYISISIAALVFLIPVIENNSLTNSAFFDKTFFTNIIFLLLVILSIAIVLCLSCVNVHVHRPSAVTLDETPEEFHISTGLCQKIQIKFTAEGRWT
jgi:hypothetical protein